MIPINSGIYGENINFNGKNIVLMVKIRRQQLLMVGGGTVVVVTAIIQKNRQFLENFTIINGLSEWGWWWNKFMYTQPNTILDNLIIQQQ